MKKAELTPWFPRGTKPARKGVYMQHSGTLGQLGYQYWDGAVWFAWALTPPEANRMYCLDMRADQRFQDDQWRGITRKS